MTQLLKKVLSPVLNWLLEPLVCRIDDRLRSRFAYLDTRLARLDAALFPRQLPVIIKNELRNIEFLPRDILKERARLHFVGYYAADVAALFPDAATYSAVDSTTGYRDIGAMAEDGALVFLDEYHFQRFMETHWTSLSAIAGTLLVATRFEFQLEAECRTALHSLGFIEIAQVCRGPSDEGSLYTTVSHAEATNCTPRYLDCARPRNSDGDAVWLVARRYPQ